MRRHWLAVVSFREGVRGKLYFYRPLGLKLRWYGLPVFELIENVTEVYALIQKAQLEIQGPRV